MLEPEVNDSKLRIVAEFEADYERKAFEHELAEKDKTISKMEKDISKMQKDFSENNRKNKVMLEKKDNQIKVLKAKLEENGISY